MFSVSFMPNQMVDAAEINKIGYHLANTSYCTGFANEEAYGISDLNSITGNLVTAGVRRSDKAENCNVTLAENQSVHIGQGTAFFENGAVMSIDQDGIDLSLETATQKNWVYLFYNETVNAAGARCTAAQPTEGDFVLLATIEGGSVQQNPNRFCKSKVYDTVSSPLVIYNTKEMEPGTACEEAIEIEGLAQYRLMKITYLDTAWYSSNYGYYRTFDTKIGYLDFSSGYDAAVFDPMFVAIGVGVDTSGNKTSGTHCSNFGTPINIGFDGDRFFDPYCRADSSLQLQFDYENNMMKLVSDGNCHISVNGIKLELYAGAMEELEVHTDEELSADL